MSIDINQPLPLNSDVVINLEDGTQSLGTPEQLQEEVDANNVIGLQTNPPVIVPEESEQLTPAEEAEVPAEATAEPEASADEGKPAGK